MKLNTMSDAHGHGLGGHAAHGPEGNPTPSSTDTVDIEKGSAPSSAHLSTNDQSHLHGHSHSHKHTALDESALAQLVGIAILETGVLLHSVLIGLTLAVTDNFVILLVVLVFHQTFEGLGLGSRLAYAQLPAKYARHGPYVAALIFSFATPIGIAVGLGVRHSYAPNGATASIVSGILDALSAGILIYTGLVEVRVLVLLGQVSSLTL
jgi:solute carrier family 39 (zinc transporter), member 1/2/3